MTGEIKFVSLNDVSRMLEELSQEEKEALLADQIKKLPADSRSKVLGISEAGLTVVTGSFVSLNNEVAVNIQNAAGFDPESFFKAIVDYRRAERERKD